VSLRYEEGLLITIVLTIGTLLVIYGLQAIPLNPLQVVGFILLTIGGYTLVFMVSTKTDRFFFAVWGVILSMIGTTLTTFIPVNPVLSVGLMLISLSLLGVFAILRRRGGK
jgi:uncharacterized membrane protein